MYNAFNAKMSIHESINYCYFLQVTLFTSKPCFHYISFCTILLNLQEISLCYLSKCNKKSCQNPPFCRKEKANFQFHARHRQAWIYVPALSYQGVLESFCGQKGQLLLSGKLMWGCFLVNCCITQSMVCMRNK